MLGRTRQGRRMTRQGYARWMQTPSWEFKKQIPPQKPKKQRKAPIMQQPKASAPQQQQDDDLWTLGSVAFELGGGTRDLERRCNGAIVLNRRRMRCVPGPLVEA